MKHDASRDSRMPPHPRLSRLSVAPTISDEEFAELANKITQVTDFRCASYKDKCLRRRIAARMRARGTDSYAAYAHVLDTEPDEYARLLDALTINVTRFFRNWSTFERLAQRIIPVLWAKPGRIRVWSAGTASGEEAYSLAVLFYQHALAQHDEHRLSRVEIVGTDIDRMSLNAAVRGIYATTAFADTPEAVVERYFPTHDDARTVLPVLRTMVRFERRDLLADAVPAGPFDLIMCRNVIIYFSRATQETLFTLFHHSLSVGGYLVLGRVETLLGSPRSLFTPVDIRERIFQRVEP